MSHGARSLYIALKRFYNVNAHNNGRIFLSQRDAAERLGSHHNEIARWFRELQHYGFIVQTSFSGLGVAGKGVAPHWRLTELGFMGDPPTRDFLKWSGKKFVDRKESRAGKPSRGVREKRHGAVLDFPHTYERDRAGEAAHRAPDNRAGNPSHNSCLPLASAPAPSEGDGLDIPGFLRRV
jgi:hypothetical protein